VGDIFGASLQANIREDGEVVIPAGANIEGRVVDVSSAGRFSGNSELHVELTTLSYQGEIYALHTENLGRAYRDGPDVQISNPLAQLGRLIWRLRKTRCTPSRS
jgi:hypothetical protein